MLNKNHKPRLNLFIFFTFTYPERLLSFSFFTCHRFFYCWISGYIFFFQIIKVTLALLLSVIFFFLRSADFVAMHLLDLVVLSLVLSIGHSLVSQWVVPSGGWFVIQTSSTCRNSSSVWFCGVALFSFPSSFRHLRLSWVSTWMDGWWACAHVVTNLSGMEWHTKAVAVHHYACDLLTTVTCQKRNPNHWLEQWAMS